MSGADYLSRHSYRYLRVTPGVLYESFVQSLVAQNLSAVFPGFVGGLMSPLLRTPIGNVKPDLVLARPDLSAWALVEVEVETHSFSHHILPQMLKMTRASADEALAEAVHAKYLSHHDLEEVARMMWKSPRVFLVMQGASSLYDDLLSVHGVDQVDIDVYSSKEAPNEHILEVRDRSVAWQLLEGAATRSQSPLTPTLWVLRGGSLPAALLECNTVEVLLGDSRSLWYASRAQGEVLLRQPTDLVGDGAVKAARMYWNEENSILRLEPVGEGLTDEASS